jgi:hypothetical protein
MEVVINVVNYNMVQQASLASVEYPKGVNEFVKAGFTPLESVMVKPFRVKESPVQFECKVHQIIETGQEGGAGNLVICEILLMHINKDLFDEHGVIDQNKIDLVARMGGDWYCRASGNSLFKVAKPTYKLGIGVDAIPQSIRNSKILTGNNIGQLGNVEELPSQEEIDAFKQNEVYQNTLRLHNGNDEMVASELQILAKNFLDKGNVADAWKTLLTISQ